MKLAIIYCTLLSVLCAQDVERPTGSIIFRPYKAHMSRLPAWETRIVCAAWFTREAFISLCKTQSR